MTSEMGKVLAEARGDVQEGIDMTYYTAGEGRRQFGDVVPAELPNKWAMSMRAPLGVVAAITPWNFPFAIPTWKIMPALVLGNTVVFKPASYTPMLAVRLVEILEEAGLPKGVLNLVLGPGGALGDALVTHPGVDLVSFTGSSDVGSHISEIAGKQLKRVSAELGGKNAIVVMEDADLDLALEGIVWSAFGTSGQRCTAASRVITNRAVANELIDRLVSRANKMKMGHGLDAGTDLGPVISGDAQQKVHSYIPIAEKEGATVAAGGRIPTEGALGKGFFHEPTVLVDVKPNMRVAQEEIFGPVTAVIEVKDIDEAIRVVNSTKYGLSCSIFTKNVNNAFRFMRDADTGLVYVNAGTIGAEIQLPFGGTKSTGNGHREAGRAALDVYAEWKSIYVDFSGKLQRAQMDDASSPG
jgi:aldehyde dehydrogenase (NAD+)